VGTDAEGNSVDAVLQIGTFINALITLVVTGFVLFLLIKGYNRMKRTQPGVIAPTEVEVLQEIRDLLRTGDTA
jgi:large conductance mechanosensitive channel